jgi:putative peptide zinc metalloprotease protein
MNPSAALQGQPAEPMWPRLREDLFLYPGPVSADGAPTWTLHDPVANRFLRIGWLEYEILSRWSLGGPEPIVRAIQNSTTIRTSAAQVELFLKFGRANNLFQPRTTADTERLVAQKKASRIGVPLWLLKNYLFMRIPLVRPDAFLKETLPLVRWLFSRKFLWCVLISAALGLFLISRQWDHFLHGFRFLFRVEGLLAMGVTLLVVKILHELGHGYASRHFGCRVPAMGIGFLVFWPVFWTDTTDAWKLADRSKRLIIDGAGMTTELSIAALASLLWGLLPDGVLRSSAHLVASTTWIMTLTVNLNPFMRFDGYYLLQDWLDTANLQSRSFSLGRWWLRESLFNYGDPPPEALTPRRRRGLISYALMIWVYRFFLFLSIALLVYYFFFKALGLFLMLVEISWFIALPILSEFRVWFRRRGDLRFSLRLAIPAGILLGLMVLVFIPWKSHITAPAVVTAEREMVLFSPHAALIKVIHTGNGKWVAEGEPIFTLDSPDLNYREGKALNQIKLLQNQIASHSVDAKLIGETPVKFQELQSFIVDLEGLRKKQAKLIIRAPFPGVVTDIPDFLRPGSWVAAKEALAVISDGLRSRLTAYISEADLARLSLGAVARFYPENGTDSPSLFRVMLMDRTAVRFLSRSEVASLYGGSLAVQKDASGNLVPVSSVFRVGLSPNMGESAPDRVTPGRVLISAEPISIANRIWGFSLGVLIRESGW